jgi:segregation and condensation protein A
MTTAAPPAPSTPDQPPIGQPQVREPERFTGHRVHLPVFEGPLDLLLYLVRAHRYDIFDIPIHDVTTQFTEYLSLMNEVDLEYAGDFLVTAATLMQIKSRMLLPRQESENEDEMEEEENDPRAELVARLLEYQQFREAAETLDELGAERSMLFTRAPGAADPSLLESDEAEAPLAEISTFDLLRALQRVLTRVQERPVATIRREPFSIADRTRDLLSRVAAHGQLTFDFLCDDCETRAEVVITFLALLEMIRRGRVRAGQKELFGEIWIEKM